MRKFILKFPSYFFYIIEPKSCTMELELKNFKEGKLLYHHLHGIVKFVRFNYGTCLVKSYQRLWRFDNKNVVNRFEWDTISVMSAKLEKYNKKEHGEVYSF